MRIRKNFNISKILASTSATISDPTLPNPHICQLNQWRWEVENLSLWEVENLPPPKDSPPLTSLSSPLPPPPPPQPNKVDPDGNLTKNDRSRDTVGAVKRAKSTKMSSRKEGKGSGIMKVNVKEEKENGEGKMSMEVLCSEIDEEGWQCGQPVNKGETSCDKHIQASATTIASHSRLNQGQKSYSAADPNGLYYYSGFGPYWRKKRGTNRQLTGTETSSLNHIGKGDIKVHNSVEEKWEDEEEDEKGNRKRARKPTKSRSLNSLEKD